MKTKKLSEIFDVRYGQSLELNRLRLVDAEHGIAFVSRKKRDNGISAFVEAVEGEIPGKPGELTVALGGAGGPLSTFLQERPFYTGRDVAILTNKLALATPLLLYYCACITANAYRYGFGRQANRTLKDILLPSPEDAPEWVFGEDVTRFNGADSPRSSAGVPLKLDSNDWQRFRLGQLFDLKKGKRLTKADMVKGDVPYIGAIDKNNGVAALVDRSIHPGGTITVPYDGSIGEAFYQPHPYWCSDAVNVLYPKLPMSPPVALFVAALIRKERYRFNYGRKWHLERMESSEIRLPVRPDGTPDWAFMESYIGTLPYSSQV